MQDEQMIFVARRYAVIYINAIEALRKSKSAPKT